MSQERIRELNKEIRDLEKKNQAAKGWGAALGVREERLRGLRRERALLEASILETDQ